MILEILSIGNSVTYATLDCVIFFTFLRLSNKIEDESVQQIKQSLLGSLYSNSDVDEEAQDRIRFERRLKEYRWLADG